MKPTENYEQLLERFTKRTAQLTARARRITVEAHDETEFTDWIRLQGSLQAVEYLAYDKVA